MARKRIVFIIFFLSFIIALPSIIKFFKGDYQAAQIFSDNPFKTVVKTVVLRNYPEWKPIEENLESLLPQSSVNVSVSTLYSQQKWFTDLEISIVTDSKLSENQIETMKQNVCNVLGSNASKYSDIKISVSDLKFNNTNTFSTNVNCK